MPHVYDLSPPDRERTCERLASALQADERVAFACVHGSLLLDTPFRDIDVAVSFNPDVHHPQERALELSGQLSGLVQLPVDVQPLNTAPLTFRYHALRGRVLSVRDEIALADLMEDTMRRYFDIAPVLTLATREAFGS